MIRSVLAGFIGILIAVGIVWLNERLGHMVYPPPEGIDFSNPDVVRPYLASLPAWALLQLMAGWMIAVFVGIVVASAIGRAKPLIYAIAIGGIIFAATLSNLIIIPHPMWFNVISLVAILASTWYAKVVADKAPDPTE
jgi:hypothetical protein